VERITKQAAVYAGNLTRSNAKVERITKQAAVYAGNLTRSNAKVKGLTKQAAEYQTEVQTLSKQAVEYEAKLNQSDCPAQLKTAKCSSGASQFKYKALGSADGEYSCSQSSSNLAATEDDILSACN